MKFAKYILKHIVPEWAILYLNYAHLKQYLSISGALKEFLMLTKKTKTPQEYAEIKKNITQLTYLMNKIDGDNQEFADKLLIELEKVHRFMLAKTEDLKRKMFKLQAQVKAMKYIGRALKDRWVKQKAFEESQKSQKKIFDQYFLEENISYDDVKKQQQQFDANKNLLLESLYKLYSESLYYQKYLLINQEAIRKILKKHKKKMMKIIRKSVNVMTKIRNKVDELEINQVLIALRQIMFTTEKLMIQNYYKQNPKECKKNLRRYSQHVANKGETWFLFGLFSGLTLMIIIVLIFIGIEGYINPVSDALIYDFFPVCRGLLLFIVYYWAIAGDVWLWKRMKVNYQQFFQFNYHFSTLDQILKRVMILTTFFFLILIIYISQLSDLGQLLQDIELFDPNYLPTILWIVFLVFLFFPSRKILNAKGRMWLLKTIKQGIIVGPQLISHRHIFVFEQFTSLLIPLTDFNYTVCEYYHAIIYGEKDELECFKNSRWETLTISLFPYIILLTQMIRMIIQDKVSILRMLRCIKYILSITLIILSVFAYDNDHLLYVWSVNALFCSAIVYIIGVTDYRYLKEEQATQNVGLQAEFQLHSPRLYNAFLIINIPLALNQPIAISTSLFNVLWNSESGYYIIFVAILEIIRRMMNNYLAVDKDHRYNQKVYCTVGVYSYPFDIVQGQISVVQSQQEQNSVPLPLPVNLADTLQAQHDANQLLVQADPDSIQASNQAHMKQLQLTEIVTKEGEQLFMEDQQRHYQNSVAEDNMQILNSIIKTEMPKQENINRIISSNRHYKEEVNFLYQSYRIRKQ